MKVGVVGVESVAVRLIVLGKGIITDAVQGAEPGAQATCQATLVNAIEDIDAWLPVIGGGDKNKSLPAVLIRAEQYALIASSSCTREPTDIVFADDGKNLSVVHGANFLDLNPVMLELVAIECLTSDEIASLELAADLKR